MTARLIGIDLASRPDYTVIRFRNAEGRSMHFDDRDLRLLRLLADAAPTPRMGAIRLAAGAPTNSSVQARLERLAEAGMIGVVGQGKGRQIFVTTTGRRLGLGEAFDIAQQRAGLGRKMAEHNWQALQHAVGRRKGSRARKRVVRAAVAADNRKGLYQDLAPFRDPNEGLSAEDRAAARAIERHIGSGDCTGSKTRNGGEESGSS